MSSKRAGLFFKAQDEWERGPSPSLPGRVLSPPQPPVCPPILREGRWRRQRRQVHVQTSPQGTSQGQHQNQLQPEQTLQDLQEQGPIPDPLAPSLAVQGSLGLAKEEDFRKAEGQGRAKVRGK